MNCLAKLVSIGPA